MRQPTRTPRATALNCAVCMGYNAQAVDLLGMLPTLVKGMRGQKGSAYYWLRGGVWRQTVRVPIQGLALDCCVTLDDSLDLSVPPFSYL